MKDDFIELDFGEDEPESVKTPGTEKKDPVREQGKFFVSYPKDKANALNSENKSSHKEMGRVLLRHTGEGKRYEALEPKKITDNKKTNKTVWKKERTEFQLDRMRIEEETNEPKVHRAELAINAGEGEPGSIEVVTDVYRGEVDSTEPETDTEEWLPTVPHGGEIEIEVDFMEPEEASPEDINVIEPEEASPEDINIIEPEEISPENINVTESEELLPGNMNGAESEEDDFLEDIRELSDPELIDGFFGNVQEIPVPGAESLPDFHSGQIYGEPVGEAGNTGLSAIPKEREKIRWYLSLPFITLVLFIPIAGIIAGGVLLYLRYRQYHEDQQVSDLTTVYIILAICMLLLITGVYGIAHWVQQRGDDVQETVSGQSDREAAESQAREEAEEREKEELEAWLRTSAQADIGLEEIVIVTKEPSDESAEQEGSQAPEESKDGAEQNPGESAAESSGEDLESGEGDIEETPGFWESFLDKLTGKTEEADQEYLDNVASDLQEFTISGDGCAQYSLIRLASNVTLFSAAYDDRFFEERYALFTFMQSYHGSQVDNKTFYLKSSLADMFSGTVHWDATLDKTQYRYLGVIADGVPQGMGVVLVPSTANANTYIPLYAGTFVNGTLEGYGMAFKENNGYFGIAYEGYFSGGKYSGRGTIYETPSSVNFQNRLSMTDAAGNRYTAEEVSGILNAYAARYYNTMTAYQAENTLYACLDVPMVTPVIAERGRYEKGKANGYCIRYGSFGIRQFAGIMKNNVRSGQGISYYANGRIQYDGEWKSGGYHGRGILYNEDGSIWYEGEFANGDIKPVVQ